MTIYSLLKEAIKKGVITCPECKKKLEPDAKRCPCSWKNPLPEKGLI